MTLPAHYLITPAVTNEGDFFVQLEKSLDSGIKLLLFSDKGVQEETYLSMAKAVVVLAHSFSCQVLLKGDIGLIKKSGADGLHIDNKTLATLDTRPIPDNYLVAASTHDLESLRKAVAIHADFALLSPVKFTLSHPDLEPLGWSKFEALARSVSIPVYAFGGVSQADEADAIKAGGQGVAGARGYWPR